MVYNLMLSYFRNRKACSHATAIAFKIEFAVRAGLVESAPTDELCKWNIGSRESHHAIFHNVTIELYSGDMTSCYWNAKGISSADCF